MLDWEYEDEGGSEAKVPLLDWDNADDWDDADVRSALESASSPMGPWVEMPGAAPPYKVAVPLDQQRYFRLRTPFTLPRLLSLRSAALDWVGDQVGIGAVDVSGIGPYDPTKFQPNDPVVERVEAVIAAGRVPVISLKVSDPCFKTRGDAPFTFGACRPGSGSTCATELECVRKTYAAITNMHYFFSETVGGKRTNKIKYWRLGNEVNQDIFWVPPHVYLYLFAQLESPFGLDDARLVASFATGGEGLYIYDYLRILLLDLNPLKTDEGTPVLDDNGALIFGTRFRNPRVRIDNHASFQTWRACDPPEEPFPWNSSDRGYRSQFRHEECLKGLLGCNPGGPYVAPASPFCTFETHVFSGHPTIGGVPQRFQSSAEQASELVRELVVAGSRRWPLLQVFLVDVDPEWAPDTSLFSTDGLIYKGHGGNDLGRGLRKPAFRTLARLEVKLGRVLSGTPAQFTGWEGALPDFHDPAVSPGDPLIAGFSRGTKNYRVVWCDGSSKSVAYAAPDEVAINLVTGALIGTKEDGDFATAGSDPVIFQPAVWVQEPTAAAVATALQTATNSGIDVVLFAGGTWQLENLQVPPGISLYGRPAPHESTLVLASGITVGGASTPGLASMSEIRGLRLQKVQNGTENPLVVITDASPVIAQCRFETHGAALSLTAAPSAPSLEEPVGRLARFSPLIRENVFTDSMVAIACTNCRPEISYNVLYSDRTGSTAILAGPGSEPVLINNTVDGFEVQLDVVGTRENPQNISCLNNIFMRWKTLAVRTSQASGPLSGIPPTLRFNAFYHPGKPVLDCTLSRPLLVSKVGPEPLSFGTSAELRIWVDDYYWATWEGSQGVEFWRNRKAGQSHTIAFSPGSYTLSQIADRFNVYAGVFEASVMGQQIMLRARAGSNMRIDGAGLFGGIPNANFTLDFPLADSWGYTDLVQGGNQVPDTWFLRSPFVDAENHDYRLTDSPDNPFRDQGCFELCFTDAEFLPCGWFDSYRSDKLHGEHVNDLGAYSVTPPWCVTQVDLDLPPGIVWIANNFNKGNNTVGEILTSVAEGTVVYKVVNGSFVDNTFDFGEWGQPDMTLESGVGFAIQSPVAQTITFTGSLPPHPPPSRPRVAGIYLVGCRSACPNTFEDLMGFSPAEGDEVTMPQSGLGPPAGPDYVYKSGSWVLPGTEVQALVPDLKPGDARWIRLK